MQRKNNIDTNRNIRNQGQENQELKNLQKLTFKRIMNNTI